MNTRLLLIVLLLCNSSVWSPVWAEQTCDMSFPMSAPVERFTDNGDGTLFDIEPDLTWMRCSLGQEWTGTSCTGKPTAHTWKSAQDAAVKLNQQGGFAGRSDWRVPQIAELASIIERQCSNPRINLKLFPATPPVYFWTATTRRGPGMDAYAYAISFGADGPKHPGKEQKFNVRLVRGGAPKE